MRSFFTGLFAAFAFVFLVAWTSTGDIKVTSSLLLSSVAKFYGATGVNKIQVPDNLASALVVEDSLNGADLMVLATTDSSEYVSVAVPLQLSSVEKFTGATGVNKLQAPDNLAAALVIEDSTNGTDLVNFVTTDSNEAVTFQVPFYGTLSAVAAAGTTQADATAIPAGAVWVTVSASDGTKGVTLPTGSAVTCVRVMSQVTAAANTLKVYGHNSDNDTINGAAADAAYVQMAGTALTYCTPDGIAWKTY